MRARVLKAIPGLTALFVLLASIAMAADSASLRGTVVDALGAVVPDARVEAVLNGRPVKDTTSGADGTFVFEGLPAGRYVVQATATGFETRQSEAIVLREGGRGVLAVMLQIGTVRQDVVVTATASSVSSAQVGAAVTVLDSATLDRLGHVELLDPLRTVPGVAVVQTGQRGGPTGLFVRGGSSNFNKVLIDGIPVNDIGGAFDFADLSTSGIERVEVLRSANSVAYGSDAMTGVVDITTRRGRTRTPEATVSGDIGNLNTTHSDLSVGGVANALDYFVSYGHMQTDNATPNSKYRNNTVAARAGGRVGHTDISGTVRWFDSTVGSPNAYLNYGIADDSTADADATYATVSARSQWNDRLQSSIRFGATTQNGGYLNPTPTGTPSAFGDYLGNVVTINGPDGRSVTGQGILDYCCTYPSTFTSNTKRQFLLGQADYQLASSLNVAGGVRYEHEDGKTISTSTARATRDNYGAFAEARAALGTRVFVNGGVGVDHNESFGRATTPRISVAAYLREPSTRAIGDTKVIFNAGKGIKAPNIGQQLSSVYALLPPSLAATYMFQPISPERSRTMDLGVEQGLAAGKARVRASYFDNDFTNLIEYISKSVLPQLGVPQQVASALSFGAYVNSQSNTAKGMELSGDVAMGALTVAASYTYLDAKVTRSLSSGALFPSENPKYPGIVIGQYAPLVGGRPFRRPANSGSLVVGYTKGRAQVTWAHFFFGQADDSTFLTDPTYGASMLLPNKDLDPAYNRADLRGSYRLHDRVRVFVSAENAFDNTYVAASGFPASPRLVRTGVTLTLGGDR